jgi:hypothetical protein
MNIDNYINHWKNMILKESNEVIHNIYINETEQIDEATKPSFLDVITLLKKMNTKDDYETLYSSE